MIEYFRKREVRKNAHEVLRHAAHLRNLREDLMAEEALQVLFTEETALASALRSGDLPAIETQSSRLLDLVGRLTPRRRFVSFREHLEIAVVAIVVAMGFRTYFIQPFKIPTGSMQPTLYGITYEQMDKPEWSDRMPFKLVRWFIFGEWYFEVHADGSGYVSPERSMAAVQDTSQTYFFIGPVRHRVPNAGRLDIAINEYVSKGKLLWSGRKISGDHVFVNKLWWNFVPPKRGDIIVFGTDGIPTLPPKTHYIKRLVGMPSERISIDPPHIVADGNPVLDHELIGLISSREQGYAGYTLVDPRKPGGKESLLKSPSDSILLPEHGYFALGDNTLNSRDGRYWGAVPEPNLVGPAFLVYWPFSSRWGHAK